MRARGRLAGLGLAYRSGGVTHWSTAGAENPQQEDETVISDEDKSRMLAALLTMVGGAVIRVSANAVDRFLERRSRGHYTGAPRDRSGATAYADAEFREMDDAAVADVAPESERGGTGSGSPYGRGRPRRWVKGRTKLPPGTAGEYRIVSKETGNVEYVGESGDLEHRLNQHTRRTSRRSATDKSGLYDPAKHEIFFQVAKPGTSTETRRAHEKRKIAEHEPSWNRDRGGSGRK